MRISGAFIILFVKASVKANTQAYGKTESQSK
jgi:hypothetical protein